MLQKRTCIVCKQTYVPTGYHQIYCPKCRPTRRKSRNKECVWCGASFYDDTSNNTAKYCSAECRHLARNFQSAEFESKKRLRSILNLK